MGEEQPVSVVPTEEGQTEMGNETLLFGAGVGGCDVPVSRFVSLCKPRILEQVKSMSVNKFVEIEHT